jgi:hypothetical protein
VQAPPLGIIIPKGYVCPRAEATPPLDGKVEGVCWDAAPWTDDFVDISTDVVPRFRTRVKMLWDDEFFYVGAEMEEPHVWATLTEHDSVIFHDNDFEVFIDPDGDNHNYFEFEINALNTTWDLKLVKPYRDGGPALNEWEIPGMRHAVHIDGTLNDPSDVDQGWSLTLAFPWSAFDVRPPREGDQWRVNYSRVEWQTTIEARRYVKVPDTPEDNWVWSPQGVVDMHRPEMWGYVQFSATAESPFIPDPLHDERLRLHRVYYAQRAFFAEQYRYASLAELGLPAEVDLHLTDSGYIATGEVLAIRQDSLITTI